MYNVGDNFSLRPPVEYEKVMGVACKTVCQPHSLFHPPGALLWYTQSRKKPSFYISHTHTHIIVLTMHGRTHTTCSHLVKYSNNLCCIDYYPERNNAEKTLAGAYITITTPQKTRKKGTRSSSNRKNRSFLYYDDTTQMSQLLSLSWSIIIINIITHLLYFSHASFERFL